MIAVSDAWRARQEKLLAPEGFVEISYLLSHDGLQESAVSTSNDTAEFAAVGEVVDTSIAHSRYATCEPNFWVLDGSAEIFADDSSATGTGYVSDSFGAGGVSVTLPAAHTALLPGITITWSDAHGEYATDFTVTVRRAGAVVKTKTVTGNTEPISVLDMPIQNYDTVEVEVLGWSLPEHRVRIETVLLGYQVTFNKRDITSFKHNQKVCLSSGELPKNSISFSLENVSGRWNPNSPDGVERYLSERQKMTVRYGFNIDGRVEWIKAGTFYLSEWSTPANGTEADFEARDLLEYMIDETYTGITSGTLFEIASAAIAQVGFANGREIYLDPVLQEYSADFGSEAGERSVAEVLQLCANAACCVMYQDRDGVFRVQREQRGVSGYVVGKMVEYSHPEFNLTKPLKSVTVTGTDVEYTLDVDAEGEKQTEKNALISTETQASEVAAWVADNLKTRKNISGEFRADPRLDVLDNISVETRFGTVRAVLLTELQYTFSGAFKGSFTGYVPYGYNLAEYFAGEIFSGEVNS